MQPTQFVRFINDYQTVIKIVWFNPIIYKFIQWFGFLSDVVAGVTLDYYFSYKQVFYSFFIELWDTGTSGFEFPNQILLTATETWNGIKALQLKPFNHFLLIKIFHLLMLKLIN